ncbi:MAG: DUF4440 domain-containing protein [Gemmatimonadaceae bacterium]
MRARTLLLLTVLPFLGAACARPDDGAATSDSAAGVAATTTTSNIGAVREAIEASNSRYADALKRGDTTTLAGTYTDDAIVMMANMERWRGPEGVRRGFAGFLSQMAVKDAKFTTEDVMLGGDLAVETGNYELTFQPKSGGEIKDKGKYVGVWKRQSDGSWKMIRDIANSDMPTSAPPRR